MAKIVNVASKASPAPKAVIAKGATGAAVASPKASPAPSKPAPSPKLSAAAKAFDPAQSKTMNIRRMMAANPSLDFDSLKAELEAAGYDGKKGEKIVDATIRTIRADVLATLAAVSASGHWAGPALKIKG